MTNVIDKLHNYTYNYTYKTIGIYAKETNNQYSRERVQRFIRRDRKA